MENKKYREMVRSLNFTPSNKDLVLHLMTDTFLVAGVYYLYESYFYFSQLIVPILMFRMFALMHDCIHNAAGKSKWVNTVVGIISGAFCLLPYEPWKKIHIAHHKWSGNVEKDPSMGLIKTYDPSKKLLNRFRTLCWKLWIPWTAIAQHFVFWSKSYQFVLESKRGGEILKNIFSIIVPVMLYSQIKIWNFSLGIVFYLMMVEIINFPHHLRMPMLKGDNKFKPSEQYMTARSCVYPRWFARHVLNNFNLHIEHHLFQTLPWYRLDEVQERVQAELKEKYTRVENNQWVMQNKKKSIDDLLAPNYIEEELVAESA